MHEVTLPELSVWAKMNLERDMALEYGAHACPSKEQEAASGGTKSSGDTMHFVCAVTVPRPIHGKLIVVHRVAPSKFIVSKLDSIEILNIKHLEMTVEHRLHSVQVHHQKLGAWVWHFRNEWERNHVVRHIAKLYFEASSRALKISGVKKSDLHGDGFAQRFFEGASLRKEQALFLKEHRRMRRDAAREEPELSDDDATHLQSVGPLHQESRHAKIFSQSMETPGMSMSVGGSMDGSQSMAARGLEQVWGADEVLVGRDVAPMLGMHVRISHYGQVHAPANVIIVGRGGSGAVSTLIVGGGGVSIVEVEWYGMAGRRTQVSLQGDEEQDGDHYMLAQVQPMGCRVRSTPGSALELVVGLDVYPFSGMRVRLRRQSLEESPSLMRDAKGKPGTVIEALSGGQGQDAVPGGWVKVKWDVGNHGQYYTGYQGRFDLRFLSDDVGDVRSEIREPSQGMQHEDDTISAINRG